MRVATSRWISAATLPAALYVLLTLCSAPQTHAQTLSGGGFHTCAIVTGGAVKCWGVNIDGQLGTTANNGTENANPVPVTAIASGATAISAGYRHTCAIVTGGEVKCWGSNVYGQIGTASMAGTQAATPDPVTVIATGATAIATGQEFTCAIVTGGAVRCWGSNRTGQLGNSINNGTDNPNPTPATVIASGATAVAAGQSHACAVVAGGAVRCWGSNSHGALGTTTNNGTSNPNPVPVTALASGATSVTAAVRYTCARLTSGEVKCWGGNFYGELTTTTNNQSDNPNPAPITAVASGASAVSAGGRHTCAIVTGGEVKCWGQNTHGENGSTVNNGAFGPNPVPVSAIASGAIALSAGARHTCALVTGGAVKCWGYNRYGQLGTTANNGTENANPVPVTAIASGAVATERAGHAVNSLRLDVRGTSVHFMVGVGQRIRVELFNALGQRLVTLFDGEAVSGQTHTLTVPAGLSAGVYLVRVSGRSFAETALVVAAR